MSKYFKIALKLAFSAAFFSVLLSFVKGHELLEVFRNVNIPFLIVSFAVTVIMVVASCAKWKTVLDLKEPMIPFRELFRIYLVGYFFSNILPSTVGGDVVRSYYVGRKLENQAYSAVAVFVERFSGMIFLFFLVMVAPLFHPPLYKNPYIYIPSCAGAFFLIVVMWLWFARDPFALPNKIAKMLFEAIRGLARKSGIRIFTGGVDKGEEYYGKLLTKVKKFQNELRLALDAVKYDKLFLFRIVYLTIVFYVLTWINVYTAYLAFGVSVNFLHICAIVPAIMIVAYLPVTLLGNLGYFESVFVFYFLYAGIGGAESLAMGLLLRLKMLTMGVVGFVVYLIYKEKNEIDFKKIGEKTAKTKVLKQ